MENVLFIVSSVFEKPHVLSYVSNNGLPIGHLKAEYIPEVCWQGDVLEADAASE